MSEEDCWVQWVDSVMKLSHPYRPVWTLALLLWFTLQLLHCDISAHATQGVPNQYQSDIKVCILEEIKDVIEKGKTPLKATPKEAQTCDRMNNVCIIQWRDDPPPPFFYSWTTDQTDDSHWEMVSDFTCSISQEATDKGLISTNSAGDTCIRAQISPVARIIW